MRTDAFDYHLPEELIAQSPALPRESCRLLVLNRQKGVVEHRVFTDILDYLNAGDLLVVNNTKVMPARLIGRKDGTGSTAEILLLRRLAELDPADDVSAQHWEALVKPGRRLKPGASIDFGGLRAQIVDWAGEDSKGQRTIRLQASGPATVDEALHLLGTLPLPPYIKSYSGNTSLYQTVYAREENSAAAPTAGLHFSDELLEKAAALGCNRADVCLEIGLDTFRKVDEEFITHHQMHRESYSLSETTAQAVAETKKRGGRVVAVGTTAVRALESSAEPDGSLRVAQREQTQLYITPGYRFKAVDVLLTNFHTPRSTLMMLVSAFGGYDAVMDAYKQAVESRYRFLSFGDAMLII
ncbi:MAG: tRNA preQ1(34) S-adenosylmethionine ribosyltransferase-isomerase QueA [Coriobacteriales bacterium]|nr:tRNA preQ1(34) S-adenosylmethionine ribosyltransferase-isomerase QueA [Coriobacteriales bacterium]